MRQPLSYVRPDDVDMALDWVVPNLELPKLVFVDLECPLGQGK